MTTKQEERTAGPKSLPWSDAEDGEIYVDELGGELVAICKGPDAKANAAYIVEACNNYENLRKFAQDQVDTAKNAELGDYADCKYCVGVGEVDTHDHGVIECPDCIVRGLAELAEAALSQAMKTSEG